LQQIIFAFCLTTSHINVLQEICTTLNIPRKARGPVRNPSRAGSGPRAGLYGLLLLKTQKRSLE